MPATTGTAILNLVWSLGGVAREQALLPFVQDPASYPKWFWGFVGVAYKSKDTKGLVHDVTVYVSPDFLSLGNETDWVRVPLWPATLQRICDAFSCVLPTTLLADRIWDSAAIKSPLQVPPQALPTPGPAMETTAAWQSSQQMTQRALAALGATPGQLVDGVKKNVMFGPNLDGTKVAIYGGRYSNGALVQPYSTIHAASYSDYSQCGRLIQDDCIVDGQPASISKMALDQTMWPLVIDASKSASSGGGQSFAMRFPNSARNDSISTFGNVAADDGLGPKAPAAGAAAGAPNGLVTFLASPLGQAVAWGSTAAWVIWELHKARKR